MVFEVLFYQFKKAFWKEINSLLQFAKKYIFAP